MRCLFAVLVCVLTAPAFTLAKPPTLEYLYPAGASRGQTIVITVEGTFDSWPMDVHVDGMGVRVTSAEKKGELRVEVAPDAPVGRVWLRLHDAEGASRPRPFLVGTLPEALEIEPNDDPMKAQILEDANVVMNGRLEKRGDVDGYAVTLKRGQTLVAALDANGPLGSPMDGVVQVALPSGIVLEQADDSPGRDPRLIFRAPEDGTYVVRVFAFPAEPNSSIEFYGAPNCVYRLTLTTGGYLDYTCPLVVSRESPGPLEVVGWNIPEDRREFAPVLPEDGVSFLVVSAPGLAGSREVEVVGHAVVVDAAGGGEEPPLIPVPVSVTGRIDPDGDQDTFRFQARKGEGVTLRLWSRSLGFPLDATLKVLDSSGKTLVEQDDPERRGSERDPLIRFDPPADGEYRVVVGDLNDAGGPRHVYRLDVAPRSPEARLRLKADRFTIEQGKPLEIAVTVERQDDSEPIEVSIEGLPEHLEAAAVSSSGEGKMSKEVTLSVKAKGPGAWSGPIRVVGQARDGRKIVATYAMEGIDAEGESVWLSAPGEGSK